MTGLENIQCILSVKLSTSQIFLFVGQAWKHDSRKIVVTAVTKCLREMYFLFRGPAWKCIVKCILSVTNAQQIFCLTVRLENIPWRLLVTTRYSCCASVIHLSESIFYFMAWYETILQFLLSGKPVWRSDLKTWFQVNKNFLFFRSNYITRKIELKMMWSRRRQLNYLLHRQSGELCRVGRSVYHRVKERYTVMSTQVPYETDHISLLVIQQCQMH